MEQNKYTCPHCGLAINPASMLAKQSLKTRDTSPEAMRKLRAKRTAKNLTTNNTN